MNAGVDFAAGGIVLSEEKILLVKNKKGDSSKDKDSPTEDENLSKDKELSLIHI